MKTNKLERLSVCRAAIEYVKTQKSAKDAWMNCDRGDWMLWLAKRLDVDDRKLTLAKARCAEQVRHLMKDKRSLDALDACVKYANGEITRKELDIYAAASAAAYAAAYAAADERTSLKKSANICREILTKDVLQKYKNFKYAKI